MPGTLPRCLLLLALAAACASCGPTRGSCDFLADGYERLTTDLNSLPKLPLEQVPEAVIGEVQKCWAAHPFAGPQHSILWVDARSVSSDRYYLIFEPSGIDDVAVVFLVDTENRVLGGYQYSTQ